MENSRVMSWSAGVAATKYHRLGALKNKNAFPMVLEAGSLKSAASMVRWGPALELQTADFSQVERERGNPVESPLLWH